MKQKDFFLKTYPFFIVFFCFMFVGMAFIAYFGKEDLHLIINSYYSNFSDTFFKYYTDIGTTGTLIVILGIIIYKFSYRILAIYVSGFVAITLITTLVKRSFYIHVHRPTWYFHLKEINLHLVDGVASQTPYTFPSGHTANAFFCYLFLCLIIKSKYLQFLFGIMAFLVAFSRVYLSKHFVLDTLGGALVGVGCLVFSYYFFINKDWKWLSKKIVSSKSPQITNK